MYNMIRFCDTFSGFDKNIQSQKSMCNLPSGLSIRTSKLSNVVCGIWAQEDIPVGTKFGPYDGILFDNVDQEQKSGYCWQMVKKDNKTELIDAQDDTNSNWLRYVNCAYDEKMQNLIAYQYGGEIYYICCKPITRNTELFVWYGKNDFEDSEASGNGTTEIKFSKRDQHHITLECNSDSKSCKKQYFIFKSKIDSVLHQQKGISKDSSNLIKNSSRSSTENCALKQSIVDSCLQQQKSVISMSVKNFKNNSMPHQEKHSLYRQLKVGSVFHQKRSIIRNNNKSTVYSRFCEEKYSVSDPLKNDSFLHHWKKVIPGTSIKKCYMFKPHHKDKALGSDKKETENKITSCKENYSIFNTSNVDLLLQQLKDMIPHTNKGLVENSQIPCKEKSIVQGDSKKILENSSIHNEHFSNKEEKIICHKPPLLASFALLELDIDSIIQSVSLPNKYWSRNCVVDSCNSVVFSECSLSDEYIPLFNKLAYIYWDDALATGNFTCNLYIRNIKYKSIICLKQAEALTQILAMFNKVELCSGACSIKQIHRGFQSFNMVQYYGRVFHHSCNLESAVLNRKLCIPCEHLGAMLLNDMYYI